jgi:cytochrome o ubiquinol oxidase operon protein cyoD
MNASPREYHGTIPSYTAGFVLSLVFSALPAALLEIHARSHHTLISHPALYAAIIACALIQLVVQLFFFFHLGRQGRWTIAALCLMLLFVGIIVAGSLWIMYNLNVRMMPQTAEQMQAYMQSQDGM